MQLNKREFLKLSGLSTAALVTAAAGAADREPLGDITGDVSPITTDEHSARIRRAQALMQQHDIDAILLEGGTAMAYFTGLRWGRSERLTGILIPRDGKLGIVTPYFEEPKAREKLALDVEYRTWHEDESPFQRVAELLADRGLKKGRLGIEETVRFFIVDGLRKAAPEFDIVSATAVTAGCRMLKDAHEIALMKKASEITLRAYQHVYEKLEIGMTPADVTGMMRAAQGQLGGESIWGMALFGQASAYPHGTSAPQEIREGQIVLMDCGCAVHGYRSDISRTFVFGEANKRQREVWNTVRKGQQIVFETAQLGTPAGEVDDAVRGYYESLGYGPRYQTPGLSHRTGHGIGMDIHEHINFVHGEKTPLAPGMCLSNEPGLYNFDEFGVRVEDCIYLGADGPNWFTRPPASIDEPIGQLA
ncbi:MAG: Xaa-Pro peptidase family protein [Pseudomonadota bacterium]